MDRIKLDASDRVAVRDSMETLARATAITGTGLDKTLFRRFQEIINGTFEIDLDFGTGSGNFFAVGSFDELPPEMRDSEFVRSVYERVKDKERSFGKPQKGLEGSSGGNYTP